MNPYDAYDPFARVYNRHWGFFATRAYPILEHLVLEKLPPGCAVLDLCCGTGQLAAELSRRGYRTTGLDGSKRMIEIAKKNAPEVDFVVQDARNIALPRKRTDFPLIQRWYEEVEIKERLRKAGFEELQSFDGNDPIVEGSVHEGRMHDPVYLLPPAQELAYAFEVTAEDREFC